MKTISLEQINENILGLRKEIECIHVDIEELKEYAHEDFELAEDVRKDIEESRKRPDSEFVKHEEVMKRHS